MPRRGADQLFRITYDGSITDEPQYVVMGGQTEPISTALRGSYQAGAALADALAVAVKALQSAPAPGPASGNGPAAARILGVGALEVAVLDRARLPRRAFRRVTGAALRAVLPAENRGGADTDQEVGGDDAPAAGGVVEGS